MRIKYTLYANVNPLEPNTLVAIRTRYPFPECETKAEEVMKEEARLLIEKGLKVEIEKSMAETIFESK